MEGSRSSKVARRLHGHVDYGQRSMLGQSMYKQGMVHSENQK